MESQVTESAVFPSQSYSSSFFTKFPTDSRFLQVTHQSFEPVRVIDGKDIEFNLNRYSAGNVIMIQDTTLNVRIKIVKADGVSLPNIAKFVAPRNNILHTLFSSVTLTINNTCLTTSPENYCYKAFITNMLSYSASAKSTHLQLQGYSDDNPGNFDSANPLVNFGFAQRNNLFRKDYKSTNGYRPDGAQFCGRLYHELTSCETGLPPNTKVRLVLTKNLDSFILQSDETDEEQYKVKITSIDLTVPIAQLSQNVFDELSYLMSKKEDVRPVTIQYRRIEIRPISIPKDKVDFQSGDLFPDADLPCRIVIGFVDARARIGNYYKNPYYFRRKWTYKKPNSPPLHDSLEQRVALVEEIIKTLTTPHNETNAGIEPQASSSAASSSASVEKRVSEELQRRLRQIFPRQPQPQAEEEDAVFEDEETTVYIKKIDLKINSSPIDQIDDKQTEDECLNSYFRLCQTTGVLNSPYTNGISYYDFRNGQFLSCYDLSTSSKCGTNYVIPTVRSGHLRIRLLFYFFQKDKL